MLMILAVLNRLFLLCSVLFLLCGIGVAIVDAARSIGSSLLVFTSLHDLLSEWQGDAGQFFGDAQPQGLADMALEQFFDLPVLAIFMALALLLYLVSYIFKTN
ncbi:hypothetical protein ACI0FM_02900 [Paenochrobactrum sp. BZR 588]|uniref:hypothetical protein n=1 Tax=Paenochrobactrum TaxID=999488 RepID=UPI0035BBCCBD